MGKIVRDERYTNTLWCLCNNEDEYPVVVHYDNYHKNVLWMSLNKLKE